MVSGLPDYTKYVTPQVTVVESERPFGTKAETVTKKTLYLEHEAEVIMDLDAPPAGQKTGLILIVATTDGAGGNLVLETWQSGAYVAVWDELNVEANAPLVLPLPCFVPTQDVGDGTQKNVRIRQTGACGEKLTVMAIYFEEESA